MIDTDERAVARARRHAFVCAGVAGVCAFLAAAVLASSELGGLGGDNAEYVLLARSLRDDLAYVTTWGLGEASAHTTYPPLFPLLLSPFVGSAPQSFFAVHLALSAAGGLAVGLVTLLAARRGVRPLPAAAASLGVALSALWLRCATDVLSELPFLAFVAGALLALEGRPGEQDERTPGAAAVAAACAVAAVLTRTAAVALVPWVLWSLLAPRRRGGRSGFVPAVALALVTAAWFAYGALAGAGRTYVDVLARGEGAGDASFAARFWASLTTEYLPHLPAFVFPGVGTLWDVAGWFLWALAALGVIAGVRRTRTLRAPEGFALTYLAMLCAWNFRDSRFGLPLIPFVLILALEGASFALAWARSSLRRAAVLGVALVLVVPNAVNYERRIRPRAWRTTPAVAGAPRGLRTPDIAAFHATWGMTDAGFREGSVTIASFLMMCDAIRVDASAPAGPLMASNPRVAALLTGRRATTTTTAAEPPADAIARMRATGVELLLVDSFADPRSSAVRELVRRHGDEMGRIGRVGDAYLFRLRPRE